ncbi:MAG TPA: 2OG-Fe(II) oxygenase [Candidatus Baltobacteraceae bacterium]|jgi:predicted 2-oxoglutarate/Fe(II)-dependent dioxygenase YbiX
MTKTELAASLPASPNADSVEIGPRIYALRVFTPAEAAMIVSQAMLSPKWFPAVINASLEIDRDIRNAEILFEEVHALSATYRERLEQITRPLADTLAPGSTLQEVQLVRYAPGGKYVDHRDGPTPGALRRVLSVVCYLNDRFAGGETTFSELNVSVSPLTGTVIVFPPEYLHRADPVQTGKKYVITAWYHASENATSVAR